MAYGSLSVTGVAGSIPSHWNPIDLVQQLLVKSTTFRIVPEEALRTEPYSLEPALSSTTTYLIMLFSSYLLITISCSLFYNLHCMVDKCYTKGSCTFVLSSFGHPSLLFTLNLIIGIRKSFGSLRRLFLCSISSQTPLYEHSLNAGPLSWLQLLHWIVILYCRIDIYIQLIIDDFDNGNSVLSISGFSLFLWFLCALSVNL